MSKLSYRDMVSGDRIPDVPRQIISCGSWDAIVS